MKQLAIITVALIALTGCSAMDKTMHISMHNHKHDDKVTYACSGYKDTHVHAEYNPSSDIATLSITAHSLGLDHQKVMLKRAVSGSGVRYVNDLNPNTVYEWHAKGDYGMLTITTPMGEYKRECNVSTKDAVH